MSNEITISKGTLVLFAGLILAIVVGGYVVFGNQSAPNYQQTNNNQQTTGQSNQPNTNVVLTPNGSVQEVYLKALSNGDYDRDQITVKKGIPVRLHFSTQGNVGCGRQLVIRGLGVQAISNGAEQVVEFTPQNEGTYQYSYDISM
jgi:hypothetical protein